MIERVCYECARPVDVLNESHRLMDVYHEKDNPHMMQICAHERCIIGSPNERNWQYALKFEVMTREELAATSEAIMKLADFPDKDGKN